MIDLTEDSPLCKRQRLDHGQAGGTVIDRFLLCALRLLRQVAVMSLAIVRCDITLVLLGR